MQKREAISWLPQEWEVVQVDMQRMSQWHGTPELLPQDSHSTLGM